MHKFDNNTGEIYDDLFKDQCENFDVYPFIIPYKKRLIAIGDIHGDMNIAIKCLFAAKVILEVDINIVLNNDFSTKIKEHKYKLKNISNDSIKLVKIIKNITYKASLDTTINQFDLVFRYYKINNNYYVKIIQNNKLRWFKWTGDDTYVIQVGDQIDRCRPINGEKCTNKNLTINDEDSDNEIMLFYDSLHKLAKKHNGAVISLLGNHEIMNINGDLRYVSYLGLINYSQNKNNINDGIENRINSFKHIMSKRMACTRSTILIIGDYLFVHAGIALTLATKYKLFDINLIIRKYLLNSAYKHPALYTLLEDSKQSPLWYRELSFIPDDINQCHDKFDPIISQINNNISSISTNPIIQIKGMIIGHTPNFTIFGSGITTACDNSLIRTDVGSSDAFNYFKSESERVPQVVEILTNLDTKESSVKILYYN